MLEHLLRTADQFQLADLRRTVQRFVAQANPLADEFQAVLHVQAVGGIRQLHPIARQVLGVNFDHRQAADPQAQGHGPGVQAHAIDHHRVAVRDQVLPVGFGGCHAAVDGGVQGKIDAVAIGADEPGPLAVERAVVKVILMVFLARRDAGKGPLRVIGIQHPDFAGGLAAHRQQQLLFGARSVAVHEEAAVGFMEHFFGRRAVQAIAQQLVRAMGVVQLAEKQGQAVVGPGHAAVAVLELQFTDATVGQFLHEQRIDLVARGIDAVGQALVIGADAERAEGKEAALGQFIRVQQQLLPAFIKDQAVVGRARAAVVTGVFVTGRGARVIQVGSPRRGQGQVGFENPALDLLEQGFAQPGLIGGLRLLISVFSLEVVEHRCAVALLQPGVRVGSFGLAGNRGVGNVGG
ncbi:hypothetical protein D3C76_912520 [compost metagenome]